MVKLFGLNSAHNPSLERYDWIKSSLAEITKTKMNGNQSLQEILRQQKVIFVFFSALPVFPVPELLGAIETLNSTDVKYFNSFQGKFKLQWLNVSSCKIKVKLTN